MTIPTPAAYWKLDEASGSRADSIGSETLTDNNTVTSASGVVSTAASFASATSEYLSKTDDAVLSMGAGVRMTLAGWFYFTGNTMGMAGKWTGAPQNEYLIYNQSDGTIRFYVSSDGTNAFNVGSRTPTLNAWHFVAVRYDGVNISIRVDALAWENLAFTADIFNGTGAFEIGRQAGVQYLNGRVDELGLWKVALTDAEVTELYNGGAGRTHPFPAATPTFYLIPTNRAQGSNHARLQVGGDAPMPFDLPVSTGWRVGTRTAPNYARMQREVVVTDAGDWGTTAQPSGVPLDGECFRTGIYRGVMAAGTWTVSIAVEAVVVGGSQDGRIRCRIWRSFSPTGEGATEVTSGAMVGTTVTNLTTAAAQISVATQSIPALTLQGEYLFYALAWEVTGAGASSACDVWICLGPNTFIDLPTLPTEIPGFYAQFHRSTDPADWVGDTDWEELSPRFMGYRAQRGRQDNLSGIAAGSLACDFDDDDAELDPENSASSYYPDLKLKRALRVVAYYGGETYYRGTVLIDSYAAEPLALGANVSIAGQDLYKRLLNQKITGDFPAETDWERVDEVLAAAGIASVGLDSDGTFQPPAASLLKTPVLEHLDLIVKAGRGTFYILASGSPVYHDRHWRLSQTSIGTFGAQGDYPIPTPQPVLDDAGLFNQVTMERAGSTNEVQRISMGGTVTAGLFYLSFRGQTTAAIPYNATSSQVDTALEALSTIGSGNVSCSGGPLPGLPIDVTFTGTLGSQDVPEITVTQALGGTLPVVAVSTITHGIDQLQIVDDTDSQDDYGVITFELESAAADLLASDEDALQWSQWFLLQHAQPTSRFRRIQIDPWADPALWPLVFAADIGTKLTIHHDLPGTSGIDEDYYVEGIEESVVMQGDPNPVIFWNVSRVEADEFAELDTSTLDSGAVLAY